MNDTSPPDRVPEPSATAQADAGDLGRSDRPTAALDPSAASSSTAVASDPPDGGDQPGAGDRGKAGPGDKAGQGDVGDALRTIYQQTIEENVPDEMLDLLGRLD